MSLTCTCGTITFKLKMDKDTPATREYKKSNHPSTCDSQELRNSCYTLPKTTKMNQHANP